MHMITSSLIMLTTLLLDCQAYSQKSGEEIKICNDDKTRLSNVSTADFVVSFERGQFGSFASTDSSIILKDAHKELWVKNEFSASGNYSNFVKITLTDQAIEMHYGDKLVILDTVKMEGVGTAGVADDRQLEYLVDKFMISLVFERGKITRILMATRRRNIRVEISSTSKRYVSWDFESDYGDSNNNGVTRRFTMQFSFSRPYSITFLDLVEHLAYVIDIYGRGQELNDIYRLKGNETGELKIDDGFRVRYRRDGKLAIAKGVNICKQP